ncbi:MAG: hypothetical protein NVSMB42_12930 [Herpetosiphon sp.]
MTHHSAPQFDSNFVPLPYRQVSVQPYNGAMTERAIVSHLLGRDSYRRTRFVILRQGASSAVAWVDRASEEPLFSAITAARVLALPGECVWSDDETVDTANPSALAAKAASLDLPSNATLIVHGMDEHVNFIYHAAPLVIRVVDVVPPEPPKLLRMAHQVLTYAQLPAITFAPQHIDLRDLARGVPDAAAYLLPCRASGLDFSVPTYFLDERPARQDWTMLACDRSRSIHHHFYGDDAPRIDFCPRNLVLPDGSPTLVRCCMLEDHIEVEQGYAVVPWGATLHHIEQALHALGTALPQATGNAEL